MTPLRQTTRRNPPATRNKNHSISENAPARGVFFIPAARKKDGLAASRNFSLKNETYFPFRASIWQKEAKANDQYL